MIIGEFRIGEPLSLVLDATSGDPLSVALPTARMKPAIVRNGRPELAAGSDVHVLAVTYHAQDGATPAGWTLTLADTSSLAAGIYGIDARVGDRITEQTAFVQLSASAMS